MLVMFMQYGELLYEKRVPLMLIWAVYMSYVRPALLYGSEAWRLR